MSSDETAIPDEDAIETHVRRGHGVTQKEALWLIAEIRGLRKASTALTDFIEEELGVYDEHDPAHVGHAVVTWDDISRLGDLSDAVGAVLARGSR